MQVNANAMNAMSTWMNNSANNVANVNTQTYKATQTTLSEEANSVVANSSKTDNGTDLTTEFTDQIALEAGFEANTKPIQTEDEMIGSLLDMNA